MAAAGGNRSDQLGPSHTVTISSPERLRLRLKLCICEQCISLTGDGLFLRGSPDVYRAEPNLTSLCPQDLAVTAGEPVFTVALH